MKNKITIEPHNCKTIQEKLDCEFCLAVQLNSDCDDITCRATSFFCDFRNHQVGQKIRDEI